MRGLIVSLVCLVGWAAAKCGTMCCPGRNNTCHATGRRLSDTHYQTNVGRCFCDESCVDMRDCCYDYEQACAPVDCEVSSWSPWSQCSTACGLGMVRRSRTVVQEPRNGGTQCPSLRGSNVCMGRECHSIRQAQSAAETARIMPGAFGIHRTSNQYDYRKDIRRNLFNQYHAQSEVATQQSCRAFSIVSSKRACGYSKWGRVLRAGRTVCVECQQTAMKEELGWRCRGQGHEGKRTYWTANGVSGCHGWWELKPEASSSCRCTGKSSYDFLFV